MAVRPVLGGEVTSFDDAAGLGTVRAADGRELPFHCTAVADGSRSVEVGAAVSFVVVAGPAGCWEASSLVPAPR